MKIIAIDGDRYEIRGGKGLQAVAEIAPDGKTAAVVGFVPSKHRQNGLTLDNVRHWLSRIDPAQLEKWASAARKSGKAGIKV